MAGRAATGLWSGQRRGADVIMPLMTNQPSTTINIARPAGYTVQALRLNDAGQVQRLARAQATRHHAQDARLPERITLPPWLLFSIEAHCWLAHPARGPRQEPLAALCAERERWDAASPLANIFPRRYLRLRFFVADAASPADVLPPLLAAADRAERRARSGGRMLLAPQCDAALAVALRRAGFAPYHVISAQPLYDLPPGTSAAGAGVIVRLATQADLPVVARLMADSWRYHARHQSAIQLSRRLLDGCLMQARKLMGDGRARALLVAEQAGQVIGFFGIGTSLQDDALRPMLFADGLYGDIFEVAVRADRRRQGVGAALLRAAWNWFAARDVEAVFVNFAPTNPASSRFWPKHGFDPVWVNWWRA